MSARQQGFSFIEVMVLIACIAILTACCMGYHEEKRQELERQKQQQAQPVEPPDNMKDWEIWKTK